MDRSIYGFIWRFSRTQQLVITAIALASFPFLYASLQLPIEIVNGAIGGKDFPKPLAGVEFSQAGYLLFLCGVLFVLYLINPGFLMVLNTYKNVASERMLRRLRYMLYQRILRYPPHQFARSSQGELSSMVVAETEQTREFIADALALPLFQGGKMLTILFFMFAQDPLLGLAAMVIIPVQAYVVPKLQRQINQLGRVRVLRAREVAGRVSEGVSGIRDIRTHRTEMFSLADFSHFLGRLFDVRLKIFHKKYFMKALNVFMLSLTPLLFYTVGGLLVIWGDLTLGSLVAVIGAYGQLTSPWKELLKYYQRLGDAQIKYQQLVAAFDLDDLHDEKTLEGSLHEPETVSGQVRLDGVTVTDEDGSNALEQISFEIEPGGRIAVVSDSVGRDRLAQLLLRVVRPNTGKVRIDGKDLSSFDERTLGARIGYAGPDSYIFNGNVESNATYALQQHLPEEVTSETYNLEEALASGNSPYDSTKDWTDLAQAGIADKAAFRDWQRRVLTAVELDDVLFQRALGLTVDASLAEDLPEIIIQARESILEQLKARPDLRGLVHAFDFEHFNPNASVATNIMFGKAIDPEFAPATLGQNAVIRSVLAEAGIEKRFQSIGFKVAKEVVELFDEPDAATAVLDRLGFIDHATLVRLGDIVDKVKSSDDGELTPEEDAELISLTCQLNAERHRLGHIDKRLKRDIVKARKLFHEKMPPDELNEKIAVFDPAKFNPLISLRCNLIYGRVNLSRSNAEQQINALIKDVLTKHGMVEIVLRSALAVEVGIGGQRLPLAARQSLALARNVLKRPSIVILNDALSAHDREARDRIRRNVISLLPQASLIWIDSEMPDQSDFDDVLVLRNGRIEERLIEAPKPELEVEVAEPDKEVAAGEAAMPRNIGAEAAALSHVPMFAGVRPANLKILALSSQRIVFEPGEYLMREGEEGNSAYMMLSGEAEVVLHADAANEAVIATLGRNSLVGEIALLADVPRSATVRARETIEALEIDKGLFLMLIDQDPKLAAAVARTASERLANMLEQSRQAA